MPAAGDERVRPWLALGVLFCINLMNFYDRLVIGAVGEAIALDWQLGDTELGYLGTAFILLYAVVGLPLGRLADRTSRTRILTVGVAVWSVLTALSGFATRLWHMVVLRLAVGVGEASCAPAANSLLGDLFPATSRARAMSIFMLGLPVGNALALLVSGIVTQRWGWQAAFFVALAPGILCALAAARLREPPRGAKEQHAIGDARREGSPLRLVLSIPTMRWIIVSGAVHNFSMYTIGGFLAPLVIRVHGLSPQSAGLVTMAVFGLAGVPGMLLGGVWGDAAVRRHASGRLRVGAAAAALSVPLFYVALGSGPGDWLRFGVLFGLACASMYVYYATVYTTIQDIIEPSLRATAMAVFFLAMYTLGGALGPIVIGRASDHFAREAAAADGVVLAQLDDASKRPYRARGLNTALFALPIASSVLTLSLIAGARTVRRDVEALQAWMRSRG
ncbi:MAG: MFS transporter [Nannocystaceae bacterium]